MKSEAKRLPEEFLERLRLLTAPGKFDSTVNTFVERKPTTFRVNTLKTIEPLLAETLQQQGFRIKKRHDIPGSYVLKNHSLRKLQDTECYQKGEIYVQNLSSMVPPLLLDPQPGESVLDMTAAPGSKTTQMSAMMKGQGSILANDNSKVRFFKLKANVEMQGAVNVKVILGGGEKIGRKMPNHFDRVLLDAPCSAEGRFFVKEPASFKFWKPKKLKEMASRQKMLFYSAFKALKPEGVMVYSTCTFSPEENEGVLDWAIDKFGDAIEMQKIILPFVNQRKGILKWRNKEFSSNVAKGLRITPTEEMEAFFVAKMKKTRMWEKEPNKD